MISLKKTTLLALLISTCAAELILLEGKTNVTDDGQICNGKNSLDHNNELPSSIVSCSALGNMVITRIMVTLDKDESSPLPSVMTEVFEGGINRKNVKLQITGKKNQKLVYTYNIWAGESPRSYYNYSV